METLNDTAIKRAGHISDKCKAISYRVLQKFTDHVLYGNPLEDADKDALDEFVNRQAADPETYSSLYVRHCVGDTLPKTGDCAITGTQGDTCELILIRRKRLGYRLTIEQDCDAESPREWDNIGTLAWKHGRRNLGGDNDIEIQGDPIDWLEGMLEVEEFGVYSSERLAELEDLFFDKFIGHRFYIYDHGNIGLSITPFSCRWDSGQAGYIYCSKEKAAEEHGADPIVAAEKALKYMEGEIDELSSYLSGDVLRFDLIEIDEDGEESDRESCGGFYSFKDIADHIGEDEDAIELFNELNGNTGTVETKFSDMDSVN